MNIYNIFRKRQHLAQFVLGILSLLITSIVWAAEEVRGVDIGGKVGAIVGLIIGAAVMFRIHPILGVATVIGFLVAFI